MKKIIFYISIATSIIFAAASTFLFYKIKEQTRLIDELTESVKKENIGNKIDDVVIALSKKIYIRTNNEIEAEKLSLYESWESSGDTGITTATALRHNGYGLKGNAEHKPDETMSRILLNTLWQVEISARKLYLSDNDTGRGGGHALVEFPNGARWQVIDPCHNTFVWRLENGMIAGVEEIKTNKKIFEQIYKAYPGYPFFFDNPANIRWEKIPPLFAGIYRLFIDDHKSKKIETPQLFDNPRLLFRIISIFITSFSAFISILVFLSIKKDEKLSESGEGPDAQNVNDGGEGNTQNASQ